MKIKVKDVPKKKVYCPKCGRRLMKDIPCGVEYLFEVVCKHCGSFVVYDSLKDEETIDNKQRVVTSTGKRFY